jgi:hypothetical protein
MLTLLVAVVFVVLLALEWWRGLRTVRVGAVLLALVVLEFAQPVSWRAARRALSLSAAERLTAWPGGGRVLSEYESGVLSMHEMVVEDAQIGADARHVALGALVWLSISPVLRRAGSPRTATSGSDGKRAGPILEPQDGIGRASDRAPAV